MSEMIPQESDGQGTEQCFSLYELWECKYRDRDESTQVRGFQSWKEEKGERIRRDCNFLHYKDTNSPSNFY